MYFEGVSEIIPCKKEGALADSIFLARVTGTELPVTKRILWEEQIGSLEFKSSVLAIIGLKMTTSHLRRMC